MANIRKGQASDGPDRATFNQRYQRRFVDPAFDAERDSIARLADIAWQALQDGRKAPLTEPGGADFADPEYPISLDWLHTRSQLQKAQARQASPHGPGRVLVVVGSARNDGSCPGEVSKTWRLAKLACAALEPAQIKPALLDLSALTLSYGRVYGVFVHGDVAGVESQRRNLTDRLDWMGLQAAGQAAVLDRDFAVQEEVRQVALAVADAVVVRRASELTKPKPKPDASLAPPRSK